MELFRWVRSIVAGIRTFESFRGSDSNETFSTGTIFLAGCTLYDDMDAASALKRLARRMILVLFILSVAAATQTFAQERRTNTKQEHSDDLTPIQVNGKWGYVDNSGKIVIKPQFSRASEFSDGLALVWTGGAALFDPVVTSFVKMGYIDRTGRWVIHSRWEYYFFYDFSEGLVPFRKQSGKWGYMNTTGKIVIRPRFDWAGNFSGGIAPALLDGKCSHIDKTGTIIDQSAIVLPRTKYEQDKHGTYRFKPQRSPCS